MNDSGDLELTRREMLQLGGVALAATTLPAAGYAQSSPNDPSVVATTLVVNGKSQR